MGASTPKLSEAQGLPVSHILLGELIQGLPGAQELSDVLVQGLPGAHGIIMNVRNTR